MKSEPRGPGEVFQRGGGGGGVAWGGGRGKGRGRGLELAPCGEDVAGARVPTPPGPSSRGEHPRVRNPQDVDAAFPAGDAHPRRPAHPRGLRLRPAPPPSPSTSNPAHHFCISPPEQKTQPDRMYKSSLYSSQNIFKKKSLPKGGQTT